MADDEPRFLRAPPETRRVERTEATWTVFVHPQLSLEYPDAWTLRRDPGGFSWQLRGEPDAEVFLHLFGFEKSVPPLDVFLESQRRMLASTFSTISHDATVAHPSGLSAHAINFTTMEGSRRWAFHARYLRDDAGIYVLKLDAPSPAKLAAVETLDRAFATMRPVGWSRSPIE